MAQEIMVAGAIYEDVPSVRLPDSHGVFHPFADTSDTTAVAADVAQGKTFHLADGSAATGTAAGATLVTKTVTANGTYSAEDDDADGYSEVTVNVSGGGGGGGVDPKDVNFIDYDGTIVHSYTAAEFAALTAMPENPTHEGLVSQGWNWTLADAQAYVAECGMQTIGQMYATASGDTEIDIELQDGRLSPYLGLAVNGTVTIDWGDGSTPDTVTGTSLTAKVNTPHTYAAAGMYTISVHVDSGSAVPYATSSIPLLHGNADANRNIVYANSIKEMRWGDGFGIRDSALYNCTGLEYVTMPTDMATAGANSMFYYCYSLKSVTFPSGMTSLGYNMCYSCYSLRSVSLPSTVTTLSGQEFMYCFSLKRFSYPRAGTSTGRKTTNTCYSLEALSFPSGYTGPADSAAVDCRVLSKLVLAEGVSSIRSDSFNTCKSLSSVTIPSTVTQIQSYAFSSCYGLGEVHFKRSTPPTVSSANAFSNLPTDCKIYVPAGTLSAYTSATNYPDPNTYTYVEE